MNGTSATTFAPDATTTRGQMAAILYRAAGSPSAAGSTAFSDVPDTAYYAQAVRWANANGIITGYSDGTFRADHPVTREQMTTILWRYAGSPAADGATDYNDEAAIASYAATAVDWASVNSMVAPLSTGVFAPKSDATRAHVAAALMSYSLSHPTTPTEPDPAPSAGAKVLIAYFSATNNTESIANHLDAILDADLYEIIPETPYTSADLNYNTDCRANREQNDSNARPAISGSVENMKQYDVIFLGYPIWWGQAPKIISTFLEAYDLDGKTIVPFCTSGSSGIGSSATNLHTLASSATWMDGQRFSGSASRSTVESWVNGLGLSLTPAA